MSSCQESMEQHWLFTRHKNPYIYIPNLIGKAVATHKPKRLPSLLLVQQKVNIPSVWIKRAMSTCRLCTDSERPYSVCCGLMEP